MLLDTHVFLWLLTAPERIGDGTAVLADPGNELLVSAASAWEISIKVGIGRMTLPEPPARYVPDAVRSIGAEPLAVEHRHALAVADLPLLHRDPFDRLLVAQAQLLQLVLVTADAAVMQYDVATMAV